jgi:plastocyanin
MTRRRSLVFIAALPLLMAAGAALVAAGHAAFGATTDDAPLVISQAHRQFIPAEVAIARGATLHIVNDDNVTHHVYVDSPEMQFDSGEQPIGHTVDLTFAKAGTFTVLCAIHPTMHLKVTVK